MLSSGISVIVEKFTIVGLLAPSVLYKRYNMQYQLSWVLSVIVQWWTIVPHCGDLGQSILVIWYTTVALFCDIGNSVTVCISQCK